MDRIGLFPLKLVLFPGSIYPLHIFEDRYKRLVEDVSGGGNFAITLKASSKVYEIGCSAELMDIVKQYDDGRMDILVRGRKRIVIKNYRPGERGYHEAEYDYYNDGHELRNIVLYHECVKLYNIIVEELKELKLEKLDKSKIAPESASFFIAQKAGLSLIERQNMLELKSENQRLHLLIEHMQNLLPMVQKANVLRKIIQNDGYMKPENLELL